MDNSLLTSYSRLIALAREQSVTANNLANSQTNGFKRQSVTFNEYLDSDAKHHSRASDRGRPISFTLDKATVTDFSPGATEITGNPLDVAITGSGWFVVDTPSGEQYTRDGAFSLSEEGTLVTASGFPILGESGAIQLSPEDSNIEISQDGTVSTMDGVRGNLRIVDFEDPQQMKRTGGNLFRSEQNPVEPDGKHLRGGALERSNVVGITEMVRMMEVSKSYQLLTNILDGAEKLRSESVEKLGRIT